MARQNIPTQQNVKTLMYGDLMGVDYQSDATEISRRHSPEMVNMISDLGGNPVKRYGYRRIGNAYLGYATVDGDDWAVKLTALGTTPETYNITAAQISVDQYGEISEVTTKTLSSRTNFGEIKHVFGFQTSLYVLCTNEWLEYDTSTDTVRTLGISAGTLWHYATSTKIALDMPDEKYIPTVMTMYKPNGKELITLPIGTDLTGATEGVNVLTPFRRVEYCVTTDTAAETAFVIPNCAKMSPVLTVEVLDPSTYEWVFAGTTDYTTSATSLVGCRRPDNLLNTTTDVIDGQIAFTESPYVSVTVDDVPYLRFRSATSVDVPAGVPNVRITYAPFDSTEFTSSGNTVYYNGYCRQSRVSLMASDAINMYDSRLFAAYGVHTYYSRASEPYKIDDNYYFDVDNDVVAFAKTSSYLAIIGEDTGKNTIYLASGNYNDTYGMVVYTMKASNTGIGAVATNVSGSMNDEPIFLSRTGIYGISSNYLSEKYAINRSGKINRKLCKEPNLESAVGRNFNGYFYLAINGHMYVLDSRHKEASRNGDNSYECYYFDNMPNITSIDVISNRMFFSDGTYTYTWNDDMEEAYRYIDNAVMDAQTYVWSGTPVKCKWCSPLDGDGVPQYYKTLQKKGTMVTLAPPMQTSCQITLVRDARDIVYVGRFNGSTFSLSDGVLDAFTKKKVKKYKRLQFVIENNEPEPFGIVSIVKSFVLNNYAKR